MRYLGLQMAKSGLVRRPQMLHQDELTSTLVSHFSRGEIPPEVPPLPIVRASFLVAEQDDDIQHADDWKQRIRIHNREKKRRH